jgi:hypothetical protein
MWIGSLRDRFCRDAHVCRIIVTLLIIFKELLWSLCNNLHRGLRITSFGLLLTTLYIKRILAILSYPTVHRHHKKVPPLTGSCPKPVQPQATFLRWGTFITASFMISPCPRIQHIPFYPQYLDSPTVLKVFEIVKCFSWRTCISSATN